MSSNLQLMLDEARRQAELAKERGHIRAASYLEGKADGFAAALEALGITPIPWKPRPASEGWRSAEGLRTARS